MIQFIWDESKNLSNRRKHGITFEKASTAFTDANGRIIFDPEHSKDEDRFILLGLDCSLRLLVVCHCYREDKNTIRIISARKATPNETKQYRNFQS